MIKWLPEIKEFYKETPILLVGTKLDLKNELKLLRQPSSSTKKTFKHILEANLNETNDSDGLEVSRSEKSSPNISKYNLIKYHRSIFSCFTN